MTTTAAIQIAEFNQCQIDLALMESEFSLWWSDWEEAGIECCYLALNEEGDVVGFQTINIDGLCIAIEVKEGFQGQGIGSMLIESSGCWNPDRNECPEFWESMQEKYGW